MRSLTCVVLLFTVFSLLAVSQAQQPSTTAVPNLINYSGILVLSSGVGMSAKTVGVTFAIYRQQDGGAPLWLETQNVTPDSSGHYTVLLGSTKAEGIPAELFNTKEQLWLGVQMQGEAEQPRVLLVSVPYAMKAADAETIGGLPASAFVLAAPSNANPAIATTPGEASGLASPPTSSNVTTTGGTANTIPMFTTASNIQNSILTQTGTTAVNVGGKLNLPATGTATLSKGFNSQPGDFVASVFNSGTKKPVAQTFQWQAEPVNNNTTTASGTLNLLFGQGTSMPTETGFKISNKGIITFAAGQTLPTVTGNEMVKGNLSATGSVSGASANFTGNVSTGSQTVTGNVTDTGNIRATGQLISTVATGTAPLSVNSTTQVPNLNASLLGGLTAGNFAKLSSNIFTGNQTIQNGVLAINTTTPLLVSTMEADVNAPGALGPVLSLVNVGGNLNAGAAVDFKTYAEVGNPYNPGARIEAEDVGNYADDIVFLLNNPGAPSNGLAEALRIAANSSESGTVATGFNAPNGSGLNGSAGVQAQGGNSDPSNPNGLGGYGIDATGGSGRAETGLAGYFNGDVQVAKNLFVAGSIYAGVKDFKIDHPLDPAHKYLVHSSVESSEMMDIYTGNITLDPNGAATVQLPDWFETLNADFRYQLTAIGTPAPNLHIAQEVANQQFGIAGGIPGMKVSWQITGVRHDAFAVAHPLTVEVDKPARERGYYIHPELYGQPEEKQIEWARRPEVMKRMKERSVPPHTAKRFVVQSPALQASK